MKQSYLNSKNNPAVFLSTSKTMRLVLMVFLFISITVSAQISRVQSAVGNTGSSASTSIVANLPSTPVNGNTLIAVITTRGTSTNRVSSISSGVGVVWTRAVQSTGTNGTTTEIWYAPNVSSAAKTITVTQASLFSAMVVMEYSNIELSPLDQTANATGNNTIGSTGTTAPTTQANELLIGGIGLVSSVYTLGTPTNSFTVITNTASTSGTSGNNAKMYALEKIVTATGTFNSAGSITSSQWSGAIATFKAKVPTITSLSSTSGCIGTTITINGTNLLGAGTTAANVKIGGTAVSSVTSNSGTQIVAIVGSGTTGTVSVASYGSTITSADTFTVNALPGTPTISASGSTTFCDGGSVILTSSASSGNQWYKGGTPISGETGTTYNATTSGTYTVITNNGNCSSSVSANFPVTVSSISIGGTTSSNQTICNGSSPANITLTGSTGTIQWQKSNDNSTFTTISGATSTTLSSLQIGTLTDTTYFRALVTSGGCSSAISSTTSVTVNTVAPIIGSDVICIGCSSPMSSKTTGGTWSSNNTAKAIVNSSTGVVTGIASGSATITYSVTSNGCTTAVNKTVIVSTVPADLFIEFTMGSKDKTEAISTVNCGAVGGGSQNDVDIYYTGTYRPSGTATYQWQVSFDGMATWVNALGPSSTLNQYVMDPAYTIYEKVAGIYYFRVVITENYTYSAISDYLTLTVSGGIANLTPGTITGNQDYCVSTNPTGFKESVPATGGDTANNPYKYQWQFSTDNINFVDCTTGTGPTSKLYDPLSITQTTYYRRVVSTGSCTAISNTIAVAIRAPALTVSQTTCTSAGSITVITPAPATGVTYYLTGTNPVVATQSNPTGVFSNLAPGVYTVSYIITSGCSSLNTTVTINGIPPLASVPSASVTFQPTFFVPTGIITVSPITSGYTYSIDGINYTNTTGVFYFVSPGTYNVTAMNGTGCVPSAATVVTVNPIPGTPSKPVITVVNPNCSLATGTITVNVQTIGESYSFDNGITFQVSNVKSGLVSGIYNVIIKSSSGLNSEATTTTINSQPTLPLLPVTSVIQPTCITPTGTITVTAQNIGEMYSFDNGITFQSSNSISGLTSGSYNVIIQSKEGCYSTPKIITITLTPSIPNIPVVNVTQPNCLSSTGTIAVSVQTPGETYSFDNGVSFISNNIKSGLISGTYNVYIKSISGCISSVSTTIINALPSTPSLPVISVIQPTCSLATGSITVTVQNAGESYSFDNGTTFQNNNTITGLLPGNYNVIIKSNSGCVSDPINIPINPLVTNTYTTDWDSGLPNENQNIIFANSTIVSTDIAACTCTVNAGVNVVVSSLNTLTITNEVNVLGAGTNAGTLTFDASSSNLNNAPISNSGSLVQVNDAAINSGNIIYKRSVPVIHSTDFTYWSSPVAGMSLANFSPLTPTNRFYSYKTAITGTGWLSEASTNTMTMAKGYCVYGPQNSPSITFGTSFIGVPYNGLSELGIIANRYYLVGNPYPSAIDADAFIIANSTVLTGALYFWTHNTDPVNGQYIYNDYASYNLTGGNGTVKGCASPSSSSSNNIFINSNIPNGYIAAGQGFFVGTQMNPPLNSKIIFNNSMRVSGTSPLPNIINNNSQFFKTTGTTSFKNSSSIEKDRVWLNLSNNQGVFKQALIGYITGASNDYDSLYDAKTYDSLKSADFYSVLPNANLVIQGRSLPFDENDTVPLGFRSNASGDYTIAIDKADGLLLDKSIFIEDKLTNTVTDLKNGSYNFTTAAGTFKDRFVLKYVNTSKTLDVITDKADGIMVFYSNNYNTLIIHNNILESTVNSVALYNMAGQNISNWVVKDNDQTNIQIPIKAISSGVYIVKVKTSNGESNKKIIVN